MNQYFLKSRFYREEVLRWLLIVSLFAWASTATIVLAFKRDQVLVIGVADDSSYLIQQVNPSMERRELASFVKRFIQNYYSFDVKTYEQNISFAGDLMAPELWSLKQAEFQKLKDALAKDPLSQVASITAIDDLGDGKVEVELAISIRRKLELTKVKLKASMKIEKRARSTENPWPYQVVEISDATH